MLSYSDGFSISDCLEKAFQKVLNITVKLSTGLPLILKPVSFQCPKRSLRFMYSSERFIPPVKATLPSIIIILRWSR